MRETMQRLETENRQKMTLENSVKVLKEDRDKARKKLSLFERDLQHQQIKI